MEASVTNEEIVALLKALNEKVRVLEATILEKGDAQTCASETDEGGNDIPLTGVLVPALFVGLTVLSIIYVLWDEFKSVCVRFLVLSCQVC